MATTAVRWHIHFRNNSSSITDHLGRRAKLVPSLQVENRRLDREFHVLCPTKFGSSGVSTQPPESPAATVPSSWQKHQRDASASPGVSATHGCPTGFTISKSLPKHCRECHESKPQYLRFLHILMNIFSFLPSAGTVSMRWNTKLFLLHSILIGTQLLSILGHWQDHGILSLCLADIAFL